MQRLNDGMRGHEFVPRAARSSTTAAKSRTSTAPAWYSFTTKTAISGPAAIAVLSAFVSVAAIIATAFGATVAACDATVEPASATSAASAAIDAPGTFSTAFSTTVSSTVSATRLTTARV